MRQKNIDFKKEGTELKLKCQFNDCDRDSRADESHLYMDSVTGQYHCKKCNATGNLITFARHRGDSVGMNTEQKPKAEKPKPVFNPKIVDVCHQKLSPRIRKYLNDRGITDELIGKYKIGENTYKNVTRITIPIGDENGKHIFIKTRRDPQSDEGYKYLFYPKGNDATLFGAHNLEHAKSSVFICEGEFDAMVLESQDAIAVSSTAGAGTFKDDWVEKYFAVLDLEEVFICYDNDKPGEDGARMVAEKLSRIEGLKIYIITLPKELNGQADKTDITDYFVKHKGTIDGLLTFAELYVKNNPDSNDETPSVPSVSVPDDIKSYECKKDDYTWIFEKRKLQIKRSSDNAVVFSDIFRSEYFWQVFDNQEKTRKAVAKVGMYDKKTAEAVTVEVFSEVRTAWKEESAEEREAKKIDDKISKLITNREVTLTEVHEVVSKIGIYPKELLDIIIAIVISSSEPLKTKPPLWLMIVGNPSSIKTELVKLVDYLTGAMVYYVDSMTENAFCSGYVQSDGSETKDLLPLLDGLCLIVKDFTTIFSLNEDTLKKILGDLTSIFDENFSKFTATRGKIEYNSLFSQIGCITPAVMNRHQRYMNQLGPRFMSYCIPELTDDAEKQGFEIAWSGQDRKEIIENARVITSSFCFQLLQKLPNMKLKEESDEIKERINNMAKFVARARGVVISRNSQFTNNKGERVNYLEVIEKQVEHPWRAFQQLRSLARCLAIVRGKVEVSMEEIEAIGSVALSSMPTDRARALSVFKEQRDIDAKTMSEKLEISMRSAQRLLKELVALRILDRIQVQKGMGLDSGLVNMHFPVKEFEEILLAKQEDQTMPVVQISAQESQKGEICVEALF